MNRVVWVAVVLTVFLLVLGAQQPIGVGTITGGQNRVIAN